MTGAPKSYPPGEAPQAEARAEAALERELAPDASPLDISLDEAPAEPASLARGAEAIKGFLRHAPQGPGVYRMIGGEGEVLYVGKARSIKKRIAAYTAPERQPIRIARMISQTRSMVFVTTETEAEALLLEANLIKQLKPRYNVLLRDDKSFPYILICTGHPAAPRSSSIAARATIQGDYFGPFASAGAVFRTLNALQRAFLLRTCSDSYYANRTRPCLLYQIKRCSAPCTGEIALDDYGELVARGARLSLRPQPRDPPAARRRDERGLGGAGIREGGAAARPHLRAVGDPGRAERQSALGAGGGRVRRSARRPGSFCVEAFFFRTYQNWGNRAYFPRADRALEPGGGARRLPRAVLSRAAGAAPRAAEPRRRPARPTLCEVLSARAGHRIAIGVPQRGREEGAGRRAPAQRARGAVAQTRGGREPGEAARRARRRLRRRRRRCAAIEVYDNSHIMGTNAIGAMVVAGPEGFVKNQYRTFNIKSADLTPGDDYAMMREVLTRRFARLAQPRATRAGGGRARFPDTPDLVIIDGGRGQFEAAREVLAALGVEGVRARLDRQGAGPQRRARDVLRRGPRAVQAPPARPRAVFRPAAARRGASLRDRHASRPAQEGVRQEPARRNPRHRPGAQARPPARLRLGQGGRPRRACRSRKDARPQRGDGEDGVRFFP